MVRSSSSASRGESGHVSRRRHDDAERPEVASARTRSRHHDGRVPVSAPVRDIVVERNDDEPEDEFDRSAVEDVLLGLLRTSAASVSPSSSAIPAGLVKLKEDEEEEEEAAAVGSNRYGYAYGHGHGYASGSSALRGRVVMDRDAVDCDVQGGQEEGGNGRGNVGDGDRSMEQGDFSEHLDHVAAAEGLVGGGGHHIRRRAREATAQAQEAHRHHWWLLRFLNFRRGPFLLPLNRGNQRAESTGEATTIQDDADDGATPPHCDNDAVVAAEDGSRQPMTEEDEQQATVEDPLSSSSYEEAEAEAEEKQCRICFGGEFDGRRAATPSGSRYRSRSRSGTPFGQHEEEEDEEDEDLGRLISPCLCSGSMRHVHVKCLNRWRLATTPTTPFSAFPATSGSRSFRCPQCQFSYRIARTSISGLASSRFLIALVSFALFLGATIIVGECLALTFRFKWIRRLVLGPSSGGGGSSSVGGGATIDPLVSPIGVRLPFLANGVAYVPAPGSGITELVVRSIRAFASGEAEDVVFGFRDLARVAWSKVSRGRALPALSIALPGSLSWIPFAPLVQALARRLLRDLSLGLSLIGSASAVAFLLSSSLLLPFHVANNVRIGAGVGLHNGDGTGAPAARRGPAGRGRNVGMGSAILVVLVAMGAIRVIKQLYGFTRDLAQYLLVRAEIAILEVNPRGELMNAAENDKRQAPRWY